MNLSSVLHYKLNYLEINRNYKLKNTSLDTFAHLNITYPHNIFDKEHKCDNLVISNLMLIHICAF